MGYFKKLDKIDKIYISLTFIIVTFFCIFNTFSFASEIIEPIENGSGIWISNEGTIIEDDTSNYLIYNFTERGNYTISSTKNIRCGYSNSDIEVGDKLSQVYYINPGQDINIEISEPNTVLYICATAHSIISSNVVTVSFVPYDIFSNVISDLSYNVGITQIWVIFEKSISYISLVILFSLGVWFIKHNIIEHSKGRDF